MMWLWISVCVASLSEGIFEFKSWTLKLEISWSINECHKGSFRDMKKITKFITTAVVHTDPCFWIVQFLPATMLKKGATWFCERLYSRGRNLSWSHTITTESPTEWSERLARSNTTCNIADITWGLSVCWCPCREREREKQWKKMKTDENIFILQKSETRFQYFYLEGEPTIHLNYCPDEIMKEDESIIKTYTVYYTYTRTKVDKVI